MSPTAQPSRSERRADVPRVVEWAVAAVLILTLLAYMLLGNFTRYVADDFGTVLALRARGFWAESIVEYQKHDGHFFGTALQDAAGLLNDAFARVLPGVLIATWVLLLTLGLRHVVPAAGRLGRLVIAAGILCTTLRITPSPFLALYWMTASIAYVVPLLGAALLVWLVSRPAPRGRRRVMITVAAGLVAFLAAGEEETYTAAQTGALTLALLMALAMSRLSPTWRQKLPVLTAAWAGSVAGLGVMAAAPGNAVRDAALGAIVGARPSLLTLPRTTFSATGHFLHILIETHWRALIAMAIVAAMIGARSGVTTRTELRALVIAAACATVGAVVVVFCAIAPAELKEAGLPQLYAQIILVHVCVCAAAALGWVGGRLLRAILEGSRAAAGSMSRRRRALTAAASLLAGAAMVTGPVTTLAAMHHDLPAIQSYAATRDAQAAAAEAAHSAGRTTAVVPPVANPENMGIFSHGQEMSSDSTYYINEDEAAYYGIVTMILSPTASAAATSSPHTRRR